MACKLDCMEVWFQELGAEELQTTNLRGQYGTGETQMTSGLVIGTMTGMLKLQRKAKERFW